MTPVEVHFTLSILLSKVLAPVTDCAVHSSISPHPVVAIVTIPSALVPVVVRVIPLHSTNFRLPPVADRVAVCEVASEVFAID